MVELVCEKEQKNKI